MNNDYSILKDEEETKKFINTVLQPLKDDEVYIAVLVARKKYCETISSSLKVVNRDIIRSNDTNKILRKFKKMAIVEGIYTDKNEDVIPMDAFALYVLPEPRSSLKGYKEFTKDINEWIYSDLVGTTKNLNYYRNVDTKLFSAIHKSRSRAAYFIFDIDLKDEDLLTSFHSTMLNNNIEEKHIRYISETHGGYHIILERNEATGTFVHKFRSGIIKLSERFNIAFTNTYIELRKETMTPIPGCLQGGFLVKQHII